VRREQIAALNERAVAAILEKKTQTGGKGRAFFCGSAAPSADSVCAILALFSQLKRHMKFM
jgi:hypothetical protein